MFGRKAAYAGSFYPSDETTLRKQVSRYVSDASPEVKDEIVAVVSPHAGYVYSGPVAGWSFAAIARKGFTKALVLAPSHRGFFDGFSIPDGGWYETPFGKVPLDETLCAQLSGVNLASFHQALDMSEHSLEVQIPFLQHVLGNFTLVPVIIGTTEYSVCEKIADELYEAIKDEKGMVIVISTDLSHYYSYNQANAIDAVFAQTLAEFDPFKLNSAIASGKAEACGEGPLVVGMILSKKLGAKRCAVLNYATSGDTAGDKNRVVGYISAAFVR